MICHGSVLCHTCENILAKKCVIPKTTRDTRDTRDTFTNCGLFRKTRGVCAPFCNRLILVTRDTRDTASLTGNEHLRHCTVLVCCSRAIKGGGGPHER